ncbi:MAG TPA: hypothetical protein VMF61_15135 [Candidatus Acidoferrales bacterium]|nr:hypothetical protein [Candidatus Acidoferrales bacterium]
MSLIAHVVLNVGLCGSMAAKPPQTSLPIRVRLVDRRAIVRFDQTFRVDRGYDQDKIVEFDAPQGEYLMHLQSAPYGCSADSFQEFLPDHNRSIAVGLSPGQSPPPRVPLLFAGAAPESFLYVHPTFVLLDKSVACNKPVGDTLPSDIQVENDPDAYFAWMYDDPPDNETAQIALQLRTPTHQYHYVRVPVPYPPPPSRWPSEVGFDVTQDEIDSLASQPVDTLLCLHLWETKVYY